MVIKFERTICLSGEALKIACKIRDFNISTRGFVEEAQKRLRVELELHQSVACIEYDELWGTMYELLGLDPGGNYDIDMEYLDEHNQAYLREIKSTDELDRLNALIESENKSSKGETQH